MSDNKTIKAAVDLEHGLSIDSIVNQQTLQNRVGAVIADELIDKLIQHTISDITDDIYKKLNPHRSTISWSDITDAIAMLLTDPEMQEKVISMHAKKRLSMDGRGDK